MLMVVEELPGILDISIEWRRMDGTGYWMEKMSREAHRITGLVSTFVAV